jgi:hypothetical protein
MIDIVQTGSKKFGEEYRALIHGVPLEDEDGFVVRRTGDGRFVLVIYKYEFSEQVLGLRFYDLPDSIVKMEMELTLEEVDLVGEIAVHHVDDSEGFELSFQV